jgi:hypothetical protein
MDRAQRIVIGTEKMCYARLWSFVAVALTVWG